MSEIIDKYKFLYEHSKSGFDNELQRFRNMEDKAAKLLSFLSIAVVSYTLMIRLYSNLIYPFDSVFKWMIVINVAVTYLGFVISWSFLFRSLAFQKMPRLPVDDDTTDFVEGESLISVYYNFSETCKSALEDARECNEGKSKLMALGYQDISFTMWSLCISVLFIFIMGIISQ